MRSSKNTYLNNSRKSIYYYSIIIITASVPFLNSLDGEFVFDDGPAIVTNADVLGTSSLTDLLKNDFWGNDVHLPGSHKSFRPLTTLTFRLTNTVFGLSPFAFHLSNLLLHVVVSCLVFWLARRLKMGESDALWSVMIFAVHPIHCEAVSSIVGRADLLSTLFVLCGLFLWDNYRSLLLTVIVTILALLSKETGLVLPLLVILFDLFVSRHQTKFCLDRNHLICLVFTGLTAAIRIAYTGTPKFSLADNPLLYEKSFFTRFSTTLYLPIFHLQLLLFPKDLCFDWSMGAIPLVHSPTDSRLEITIGVYLALLFFLWTLYKRSEWTSIFCILFGIISFLPASNLLINVGFLAAERVLYLPSVTFCFLCLIYLKRVCKRLNCSSTHVLLVILTILASRTMRRNEDWRRAEALYKSAVHINPAKAYSNLGQVYAAKGNLQAAARAYETALGYRNMADTWFNLGVLQSGLGNHTEAVSSYHQAIRIRQSFAAAYLNLGISFLQQGYSQKAEMILKQCVELDGRYMKHWKSHKKVQKSCHLYRGHIRKRQKKFEEAKEDYIMALDENDSDIYLIASASLAEIESELDEGNSALKRLNQLLENHPKFIPAIVLYSRLLTRKGQELEAERLLARSINLLPNCTDCMAELALLIADRRPEDAEKLLQKVSMDSPKIAHLLNYAVILQKQRKFQDAEIVYTKVLHIDPQNTLAIENFKKLQRQIDRTRI